MNVPAEAATEHDPEAECAVLGGVLLDSNVLPTVLDKLTPTDFYCEEHRTIFRICVGLYRDGVAPDLVTVKDELGGQGLLDTVGGLSYLSRLVDALPDVANAAHYADIVATKSKNRKVSGAAFALSKKPDEERLQQGVLDAISTSGKSAGGIANPIWRTLREYKEIPGLLQPPEAVVPNLAWRGRVTLLAAREKAGKSTYAAFGAALLSQAYAGVVLWVNLEEAPFDAVNRFEGLSADPDRVIVSEYLPNRLTDLEAAIAKHTPDLVVIDTLAAWGAGHVTDWNAAAQVTPVMLELVELARRHNIALVIVHHGKKDGGSYRDSTAIGASVDVIIEMSPDDKDDHVRHFKAKGRWTVEPFSLRWTGTTYEPVGGELSVDDRVFRYISDHPDCSKREIRDNVRGRASVIDQAIERLLRNRRIAVREGVSGAKLHNLTNATTATESCPNPPQEAISGTKGGHGWDTPFPASGKSNGTKGGHGKDTVSDTPPVSHPLKGGCGDTVQGTLRPIKEKQESDADKEDSVPVVRDEVNKVPKAARPELPELPEHSRDWPKPMLKQLRELVAQGHRRIPATEILRREYEEGS